MNTVKASSSSTTVKIHKYRIYDVSYLEFGYNMSTEINYDESYIVYFVWTFNTRVPHYKVNLEHILKTSPHYRTL